MQLNPGMISCLYSSINEDRCSAVISEDQVYDVNITSMNSASAIYRFNCEFLLLMYCATYFINAHWYILQAFDSTPV